MAFRLVERPIRLDPGTARQELSFTLPFGTAILRIFSEGNQGTALLRVETGRPEADQERFLVVVRGDDAPGGVVLTPREAAGTYLGSFTGYARARGQRVDVFHVFEVAAPAPPVR